MGYASTAARAYRQIKRAGFRTTFVGSTMAVDHATGASTATAASALGYAIETPGDEQLYESLKLVVWKTMTLLFAPDAGGALPSLGMMVSVDGTTLSVKHTKAIAPGGTLLLGRVVVSA